MKKIVLLTAFILLLGSAFGQSLKKGNIVGVQTLTVTLKEGVTIEQFTDYLIKKCFPEFEKAHQGWKYYLTKGIKGEKLNSLGLIILVKSKEDRDKYFNADGTANELGSKAFEKYKPYTDELRKLGTWKGSFTDWEIQ